MRTAGNTLATHLEIITPNCTTIENTYEKEHPPKIHDHN